MYSVSKKKHTKISQWCDTFFAKLLINCGVYKIGAIEEVSSSVH